MHARAHAVRRVACFAHLEFDDVQIAAELAAAARFPEWAFHIRVQQRRRSGAQAAEMRNLSRRFDLILHLHAWR
jgi:hypothetical protein